jgi:integrase
MPIYKQESGIWRIQFCLNGKNYVKSSKTTNRKAAQVMEAEWRSKIHGERYLGDLEEITVQQLIDDYLKLPLAHNTLRTARYFFNMIKEDMDLNVKTSEFDQKQILKHVQKRIREGTKPQTVRVQLLYLSGAWNDGNTEIYNIPKLKLPNLPKPPIKTEILSDVDEEKLFHHIEHIRQFKGNAVAEFRNEIHDIFVTLLDTGMRCNELCRLEWNKIDFTTGMIEVWRKKNGVPSRIKMSNRLHEVMQRRAESKNHEKWVFTNGDRTTHRRDSTHYLNDYLKRADIPITVHICRHTAASRLLKAGFTLVELKEFLGVKNIQTVMRYAHLEKDVTTQKAADIFNARQVKVNRAKLKVVS